MGSTAMWVKFMETLAVEKIALMADSSSSRTSWKKFLWWCLLLLFPIPIPWSDGTAENDDDDGDNDEDWAWHEDNKKITTEEMRRRDFAMQSWSWWRWWSVWPEFRTWIGWGCGWRSREQDFWFRDARLVFVLASRSITWLDADDDVVRDGDEDGGEDVFRIIVNAWPGRRIARRITIASQSLLPFRTSHSYCHSCCKCLFLRERNWRKRKREENLAVINFQSWSQTDSGCGSRSARRACVCGGDGCGWSGDTLWRMDFVRGWSHTTERRKWAERRERRG